MLFKGSLLSHDTFNPPTPDFIIIHQQAESWCDWSDWNGDLENEPAVFMNMGYAPYRDHLIAKYTYLVEQCGIDGIYFDITNYWEDDPSHDHLAGVRTLIASLHAMKADLLICAENWYDHLLGIFPLFGEPGNIMGPGDLLLRYCRSIAYIACPSPLGSGGVHEKGRNYMGASTLKEVNIPHRTKTPVISQHCSNTLAALPPAKKVYLWLHSLKNAASEIWVHLLFPKRLESA